MRKFTPRKINPAIKYERRRLPNKVPPSAVEPTPDLLKLLLANNTDHYCEWHLVPDENNQLVKSKYT